ncbi:hypothetical protein T440DRAFT_4292 [Plenodomus tracheiphilus IPT5]|uniref:EGF-like domain-containing protein n=1 Tax=Plenodomus tracheiphilus IPT5 TaxID=1408161 RepID=A0A6A7BME5_9PLEO|nr:hypothetical protein T440DRAFT_4292 [Plenodomus tracheiphilus IPT5]
MSYDPRLGGRAQGSDDASDARKGSVRAARERMQAAQLRTQLPDTSRIIGLPQRPNQLVLQNPSRKAGEPTSRSVPSNNGEVSGRDSPELQWPLPNASSVVPQFSPMIPPRSPKRLQPPQQTARPVSDEYPIQQLSPGFPPPTSPNYLQPSSPGYGVSYANGELLSPTSHRSSRPLTTSSAASEVSSLGDIPDFPVPEMPTIQQTRRIPSLGPPPSARRGPSSYYTQMSYVSPIVEESESRSAASRSRHGSFASSNVFPMNDDFYPDDDLFSDDETITSDRGTASPEHDDRSGLVKQSPALVRQASLGRRTKPSLMTIKSVDSFGSGGKKKVVGLGAGAGMVGASGAMLAARDGSPSGLGRSGLSSVRGQAESSTSSLDSVNIVGNMKGKSANYAGSSTPPHPLSQEMRPIGLAERAGMRRPPKLDMEAVRDAEARGSLTSLPDLIRRATRLAANLDRGKTASRLGLDFWESGAPEKRDVRQSGLSDMLAAFPPPGQDTPLRSGTPNAGSRSMSKWPSASGLRTGGTNSRLSNEKSRKPRRCCGMPMWAFVTLLIVLLLVIAAAVIIPIVLVVIPNQNKGNNSPAQDNQGTTGGGNNNNNNNNNGGGGGSSSSSSSSSTGSPVLPAPTSNPSSDQCDGIVTCQNGGVAILNSDRSCNCICINGFTGRTCTNNDATGCTATSIADTATNATVGTGISRIVETANKDFNIPLDATRILSLFSNLSLSCAAENALITFNGLASRSITHRLHSFNSKNILHPTRSLPVLHEPHAPQALAQPAKRQTVGQPGQSQSSAGQNSNGQNSNDQKNAKSSEPQTQPVSSNVTALDFARIGVLLALQESGDLDIAASAQEAIQNFLTGNRNGNAVGNSVEVGPFEMDLVNFTIQFQNGTTIRAPPQVASSDP